MLFIVGFSLKSAINEQFTETKVLTQNVSSQLAVEHWESDAPTGILWPACMALLHIPYTLRPTRAFRAQHYLNMIITRKHGSALPFITVTATGRKDKLQ